MKVVCYSWPLLSTKVVIEKLLFPRTVLILRGLSQSVNLQDCCTPVMLCLFKFGKSSAVLVTIEIKTKTMT